MGGSAKKQMATYFRSPVGKLTFIFKRDLREYIYLKSFMFIPSDERIYRIISNRF